MTQRKLILVLGLLCIALIAVLPITAQTNPLDLDNDGLNNTVDACPRVPGPRTNRGCPLTTPTPNAPAADRDSDGVADFVDRCPDEAGTGFTEGCPNDQPEATPAPENGLVLVWDVYDRCLVGNNGRRNINIRAAVPSNAEPSPDILGALPPGSQFEPSYAVLDDAGKLGIAKPKYFWQSGWRAQHDRLLAAASAMERIPLFLSGDLHALAEARILRNGPHSLERNPV
ncbi:MAG: thrombospondin type 3 repeat-containing protein, partial [Anaerolineae bacterium]|nr:thrombospondin type 3 repeat-containing protein [Anaerolineae bacterium]